MQLAFFEGFMVAFAGEDYRSCTAPISAVLQAPSLELHALSSTFISNQVLVQLRRWFSLVRAEAAGTVAAEFSGCDVTTAGGCASLLRNLLKAAPLTMLDYMVFQQRQLKRATASPISPSLTAQPVIFATPTAPVTSAPAVVTPPPAQACIPGSGGTSSKQAPVCVWHLAEQRGILRHDGTIYVCGRAQGGGTCDQRHVSIAGFKTKPALQAFLDLHAKQPLFKYVKERLIESCN
jgi:hypothetical protein